MVFSSQTTSYSWRVNFPQEYYLHTSLLNKRDSSPISAQTYLLINWHLNGLNATIVNIQIPKGSLHVEIRANQHGQTPFSIIPGGIFQLIIHKLSYEDVITDSGMDSTLGKAATFILIA